MTPDLQKQLYDKYPLLFKQKDLSMQQTCMCWGIECGDGWYFILDMLCDAIQNYIDCNKNINNVTQVEFTQVKEKFGSLRVYTAGSDEYVDGMIALAEHMSWHTCENCGATQNIKHTQGWITTLCKSCYDEYMKKVAIPVPSEEENEKEEKS